MIHKCILSFATNNASCDPSTKKNNASCEQECALYDNANKNACNIPYIQFVFENRQVKSETR